MCWLHGSLEATSEPLLAPCSRHNPSSLLPRRQPPHHLRVCGPCPPCRRSAWSDSGRAAPPRCCCAWRRMRPTMSSRCSTLSWRSAASRSTPSTHGPRPRWRWAPAAIARPVLCAFCMLSSVRSFGETRRVAPHGSCGAVLHAGRKIFWQRGMASSGQIRLNGGKLVLVADLLAYLSQGEVFMSLALVASIRCIERACYEGARRHDLLVLVTKDVEFGACLLWQVI